MSSHCYHILNISTETIVRYTPGGCTGSYTTAMDNLIEDTLCVSIM